MHYNDVNNKKREKKTKNSRPQKEEAIPVGSKGITSFRT